MFCISGNSTSLDFELFVRENKILKVIVLDCGTVSQTCYSLSIFLLINQAFVWCTDDDHTKKKIEKCMIVTKLLVNYKWLVQDVILFKCYSWKGFAIITGCKLDQQSLLWSHGFQSGFEHVQTKHGCGVAIWKLVGTMEVGSIPPQRNKTVCTSFMANIQ